MVADGSLYALDDEAYWIDTGTPQEYVQAQLDLLDGLRGPPLDGVDPTAWVDQEASVKRSVIGPGAWVAAGARIESAVLLPGTRIGPDAVVDGSIVGERATVGAGAVIAGCSVVGDGQEVGAGERLDGVRWPEAGG
jgi:mannose-1-phosphate guanylyltransferase